MLESQLAIPIVEHLFSSTISLSGLPVLNILAFNVVSLISCRLRVVFGEFGITPCMLEVPYAGSSSILSAF